MALAMKTVIIKIHLGVMDKKEYFAEFFQLKSIYWNLFMNR